MVQNHSFLHQKMRKICRFLFFFTKINLFSLKNSLKNNVITAFLGVFRAFLGLKVYQMYQLFHLYHETVRHKKRAQS